MRKTLVLGAVLILLMRVVIAQSKEPGKDPVNHIRRLDNSYVSVADLDQSLSRLVYGGGVTGFCVGIINDNKIVYTKAYGYKDKEKNLPVDTSTDFYASSLSKSILAYITMQLVQEGVLDLDKQIWSYVNKPIPLYDYFNDLADDERWKLITVRDCLRNTTGFPNWRKENPRGNNELAFFFDPGQRFAYSGEGYVLLQLAVEEASGKNLETLAEERVFRPFGMTRTSFVWQPAFDQDFALGYDSKGELVKRRKRTTANGANSMETTISDYCRFIAAVMQQKGLNDSNWRKMISPQIDIKTKHLYPTLDTDTLEYPYKNIHLSWGLGWGVFKSPAGSAFFENASEEGWAHYTVNFPDKKTSIIMLSNSSNAQGIFKEALEKTIGDLYSPWEWEGFQPVVIKEAIIPRDLAKNADSLLNDYAGTYAADSVHTVISVQEGQLKVEMEKGGLQKTNLYMEKPDLFSLKAAAIQFQFIRDAKGKVVKMVIIGGNEHHEFKKVNTSQ